jgi:hypothetical protein
VGPRAGLDVCEKSRPHLDSIPGLSSLQSVAIPTELPGPLHFVGIGIIIIYLFLSAIWLTPGGSSTAHIYTQAVHTIHRTNICANKKKIGNCEPCLIFANHTLTFSLQLREKHVKTLVRIVGKCPDIPVAQCSPVHIYTQKVHRTTEWYRIHRMEHT